MGIRGRLTGSLWDSDGGVCVIPRSVALCVQRCRGIVLVAVGATCGVFFDYWSGYDLCGAQYNIYEDGDDRKRSLRSSEMLFRNSVLRAHNLESVASCKPGCFEFCSFAFAF
jgi:hypothetical protein